MWSLPLDDEAGRVEVGVGLAERGNDAVAAAFGGAEVDEEDLILVVMDDAGEFGSAADEVGGVNWHSKTEYWRWSP